MLSGRLITRCLRLVVPAWLGLVAGAAEVAENSVTGGWVNDAISQPDLALAYRYQVDAAHLRRSWQGAIVFVPGEEMGEFTYGYLGSRAVGNRLAALPAARRYPLVVYLHDAEGLTVVENSLLEEFEIEGFAAIILNSLAGESRASDCDSDDCLMSAEVYLTRRAEMIHAVGRARQLPWVDRDNIFLVGLGEGAAVVALWGAEVEVSAYAVAGWTCSAPLDRPWFAGLRTPVEDPVLLINGRASRWTGRPGWEGSCAERHTGHERATAVLVDTSMWNVFSLAKGRRALIAFLHDHRKR